MSSSINFSETVFRGINIYLQFKFYFIFSFAYMISIAANGIG